MDNSRSSSGPPPSITLHVSHQRDPKNNETLVFAPVAPDMDQTEGIALGEPVYHSIESQQLRLAIDDVRNQVMALAIKAAHAEMRDNLGIESVAQRLSEVVLPPLGFSSILPPGLHPRFFSLHDIAEDVPWECLEEYCGQCQNSDCRNFGRISRLPPGLANQANFCPGCGRSLSQTGGKLVLERRISHIVQGGPRTPWEGGREFVLILDPRCDVYLRFLQASRPGEREHQPAEVERAKECKTLENRLVKILRDAGYDLTVIRGPDATAKQVLAAISKPGVVGVYYFGHGEFPKDQDQGRLLLSNGEVLTANHIRAHGTTARFIFLNACWGAAASTNWGLGRKSNSVGNAFAYGNRVVLAPLWPVYCTQAAQAAAAFFEAAAAGQALMDATIRMRQVSYAAYDAGRPDISWMAYRYFGPSDRRLPSPEALSAPPPTSPLQSQPLRVFRVDSELDTDLFDFPLEPILFRAAKRKVFQRRAVVNPGDLLAGLIRRGGLLRYALTKLKIDPDAVYERILELEEPSDSPAESWPTEDANEDGLAAEAHDQEAIARKFQKFLRKFVVRRQSDFDQHVIELLGAADAQAQRQNTNREKLINEKDLIVQLLKPNWPAVAQLLEPSKIFGALEAIEREGIVDLNGCVKLDCLDPEARRIVDTAHQLAQQRGIRPIPNRLVMAAFLVNPHGAAAKLCKTQLRQGTPEAVKDILVATVKGTGADTFSLTPEVCDRIVMPLLRQAQKLAGAGAKVSEALLFAAMCQVAAPELKQLMSRGFGIDLEALGNVALKWARGQAGVLLVRPEQWTAERIPWLEHRSSLPHDEAADARSPGAESHGNLVLSADGWRAEHFHADAWHVMTQAGRWAIWERGCVVQLSHFFAALVDDRIPSLMAAIRQAGQSANNYKYRALQRFPTKPVLLPEIALAPAVQAVVTQAAELAGDRQPRLIECADLARAFFSTDRNPVGVMLERDGIRLPPDLQSY